MEHIAWAHEKVEERVAHAQLYRTTAGIHDISGISCPKKHRFKTGFHCLDLEKRAGGMKHFGLLLCFGSSKE